MNILILYRELAAYILPSIFQLQNLPNVSLTLVCYDTNSDAPYEFKLPDSINLIRRADFTADFVLDKYDIVFCCGWADNGYLNYIKFNKQYAINILCFDTEFKWNFRKFFGSLYLRIFTKSLFDYALVPGNNAAKFAKLMGFSGDNIYKGLYSANVELFSNARRGFKARCNGARPLRFLYVGRYAKSKGILDLWEAFAVFNTINTNTELWCSGVAVDNLEMPQNDSIKDLGFLQQNEIIRILEEVDIFIMPSHYEPWGVVLHEMVLAGMPVIVSDSVNSREYFLENGINGLEFKTGSVKDLVGKMNRIISMYNLNSYEMIARSRFLGTKITSDNWFKVALNLVGGVS